jgi:outer membrane protein
MISRRRRCGLATLLVVALVGLPAFVVAETLPDALAAAYRSNPVLLGQRAQQKALDETYVQARTGLRATAGVAGSANYERGPNSVTDFTQGFSQAKYGSAALTLTQPLYTGGRTAWAARVARDNVEAGREDLRAVEAQVLLSVVQAYVDVLRDQRILAISVADMATLEREVAESEAKFDLGQVTRTDVAEARAQLESARATLAGATGQLEDSRAEFQAAVGAAPAVLDDPADLPGLPATLDAALERADTDNAALQQSRLQERASRDAVAQARSALRPTVSLQGMFGYIGPIAPIVTRDFGQQASAGVTVSLPLLTGGLTASQVRQAIDVDSGAQIAIEATRRQVIQGVRQAWSQLTSSRLSAHAAEAQETAAALALKGAQAEYGYGLRKTLDVLLADEALRAAQQNLAVSRHDAYLAQAAVLSAAGGLEARDLMPGEPLYDPAAHFNQVKGQGAAPWDGPLEAVDRLGAPAEPRSVSPQ